MDNLAVHKIAGVRTLIEAANAALIYLPPYSPDLNPIEMAFANSKRSCEKLQGGPAKRSGTASTPR
jgi:transposase